MKRRRPADETQPARKKRALILPCLLLALPPEMRYEVYTRLELQTAAALARTCHAFCNETRAIITVIPVEWHRVVYALAARHDFDRAVLRRVVLEALAFGLHTWPGALCSCDVQTSATYYPPFLTWYGCEASKVGKSYLILSWYAKADWHASWYIEPPIGRSFTYKNTGTSGCNLRSFSQDAVNEWKAFIAKER